MIAYGRRKPGGETAEGERRPAGAVERPAAHFDVAFMLRGSCRGVSGNGSDTDSMALSARRQQELVDMLTSTCMSARAH